VEICFISPLKKLPRIPLRGDNTPMRKLLLLLFCLLSTSALPAWAGTQQSHEEISAAVTKFVQSQTRTLSGEVSIQLGEIDPRLSLPACPSLETFLPSGARLAGKTSVGVRCPRSPEQNGWSLFVPVTIRVRITQIISSRPLQQGQTLSAEDITSRMGELTQPGILTDPSQAVGKVLRNSIGAGQALKQDMLRAPYSVTQGQTVAVQVEGAGFRIHSEGQALNNAAEGQSVRVKMPSGQVVSGTAMADGSIEVHP
jgi:flagella basal body P-ring formation protein FlgA